MVTTACRTRTSREQSKLSPCSWNALDHVCLMIRLVCQTMSCTFTPAAFVPYSQVEAGMKAALIHLINGQETGSKSKRKRKDLKYKFSNIHVKYI